MTVPGLDVPSPPDALARVERSAPAREWTPPEAAPRPLGEAPPVFRGSVPPGAPPPGTGGSVPRGRAAASRTAAPRGVVPRDADVLRGWWSAAVTCSVLTCFAVLIVTGRVVTEGPVLFSISRTHGVHAGDVLVAAAWVLGTATALGRALAPARRHSRPAPGPRDRGTRSAY
ncbi:hypothetical protein [Quadrisphaera sp. DSM 44207]|uniref:hypothetical protein n=1 Tax=Quadrisphaera sp. DSM 44207 TaxID=1881057 RepID=UPI00088FA0B4|nr:hypothetical protein [Quadrisphaera sp. DSM 44207]SDQ66467.1 hypothetical protein SAMN05428996_2297 [Quadrisphaera sp. DSM 44207]